MHGFAAIDGLEDLAASVDATIADLHTRPAPLRLCAGLDAHSLLALAHVEAALLDLGIASQRRLRPEPLTVEADLVVLTGSDGPPCTLVEGYWRLRDAPVELYRRTERAEGKRGVLDVVALAALFAERAAPDGRRARRLRPWALAGNWWRPALDDHDDPAWNALRDVLRAEGAARVVPIPEIDKPHDATLAGLDAKRLASLRAAWPALDLGGRAERLGHLVLAALASTPRRTARLESLIWHRVLPTGWSTDLVSAATALKAALAAAKSDTLTLGRLLDEVLAGA